MKAIVNKNDPEEIQKGATRRHPLYNATSAQIDQWVDNNVNNLEDVRRAIKFLAKAIRSGS